MELFADEIFPAIAVVEFHLATLDEAEVVYLEILAAHNGPPLPSRVGGRLPAYATGVGKALLARQPAGLIDHGKVQKA